MSSQQTASPRDFRPGREYFDAPARPFGERKVRVDIVGLQLELRGLDEELEELLRDRYREFLATKPVEPCATVEVSRANEGGFLEWRPGEDPTYRMETEWDDLLLARSYGFAGLYDPQARKGKLCLAPEPRDRREISFENYLRVVYSWLALEANGFLFHSSALVREDGNAYLFFGPSGSGKSTCCTMSEGIARPVNDDLLILLKDADRGWHVAAVPFTGIYGRQEAGNRYPVAGMFRLIQDVETRVDRLSTAQAVVEVLASCPFMEERPPDALLADRVAEIVRTIPVGRLHFRKDPSFWDAVRAFLSSEEPQ